MSLVLLIGGLGILAGLFSGLLGIGGGIVMAPLLLYVPPFFGHDPLSMRVVAGLTMVQGLVACVAGGIMHRRCRFVSGELSLYMGTSIFLAALAGGAAARFVPNQALLFLFACLAFVAAVLILFPVPEDSERPDVSMLGFSRQRAISTASGVGLLGGMVGQGGSFILIPLMTSFVRIPTRIAVGSNLAIVFLSSLAGSIGKAATGQIEWLLALPIILTVIPAALLGGHLSSRVPVRGLRLLLALVIGLAALRIWYQVLAGR